MNTGDIMKSKATTTTAVITTLALLLEQNRLHMGESLERKPSDDEIRIAAQGVLDVLNPAVTRDGGRPLTLECVSGYAGTAWKTLKHIRSGQLPQPVYQDR